LRWRPLALHKLRYSDAIKGADLVRVDPYTMHHFAQSYPEGTGQGEVPALLRRVADSIEGLGNVQVHDLIMHSEITADGDWPNLTVYFDYVTDEA
jgi:hypothetical protein